ncbi:winged helix-turn-helix domain-containing protein [Streptomyces sp. NPDC091204]|uniref:helix-turn-helix domain-containing protein n=1 Tax=Streptomyces sp. NPDC091204 TaxID=3155299 RepID=UPI0034419DEF
MCLELGRPPGHSIGRLFHVTYMVKGTWRLLKRHGSSWQQPARRAIERDDEAVEPWKKEVGRSKGAAVARGACIVFEDEAGQSLRPPRARTRAG